MRLCNDYHDYNSWIGASWVPLTLTSKFIKNVPWLVRVAAPSLSPAVIMINLYGANIGVSHGLYRSSYEIYERCLYKWYMKQVYMVWVLVIKRV